LITSIKQVIQSDELPTYHNIYERFDAVYSILKHSYYNTGKLDTEKMIDHAIKAYVHAIEDPYTIYMDSEQNS